MLVIGELLARALRAIPVVSGHLARAASSLFAIPTLAILLLVIFVPTVPLAVEAAEPVSGPVTAEVVEVIDGDTLSVRAKIWPQHWVVTKIRLAGIPSRPATATGNATASASISEAPSF